MMTMSWFISKSFNIYVSTTETVYYRMRWEDARFEFFRGGEDSVRVLLRCEDGGCMALWNYGILPQHYTASQPRRPRPETSPAWKPQNSQQNTEFKIYNFSTSVVAINTSLNQPQVYQHIKLKIDNSVVSPLLLCGTEKTGQWMQKQNQNYSSWNDIQGMNCEIRSDGP